MSENIHAEDFSKGYEFLLDSLSEEESKEFNIYINKVRHSLLQTIVNYEKLIELEAKYEYEYGNKKKLNNINYQVGILLITLTIIYYSNNSYDKVFSAITLLTVMTIYFIHINFNQTKTSNEIILRKIQDEKNRSDLYGYGIRYILLEDLINLNEKIINAKFLNFYVDFKEEEYRRKMDESERNYSKFDYILNIELMKYITQSKTFLKNKDLYDNLTLTNYFTELSD